MGCVPKVQTLSLGLIVTLSIVVALFTAQRAAAGEFGQEALSSLTVTGFLQNSTGMFVDPGAMRYLHSGNALATERNFLQVDINDAPDDNDRIFVRLWGVYEPPYPDEHLARSRGGLGAKSTDDFYNEYDFHDVWWEHTVGPLQLYMGRQIAVWGQSISFRVGDVINPQDTSYAFGFANLEQSRLPLWMLHPILNLPDMGWLKSNYIEGIFIPGVDPLWNHVDYPDDRFEGQNVIAGRVNIGAPPLTRFAARPETKGNAFRFWGLSPKIPSTFYIPPVTPSNFQEGVRLHTLLGNTEMTAIFWHSHQYSPTAFLTGSIPGQRGIQFRYPDYMGGGATFDRPIYIGNYLPSIVNKAIMGAPFVLRGETFYTNHAPYDSLNPLVLSGAMPVIYSDTLNYMIALDIEQAAAPWLTETGTLTMNLEYQSLIILDQNKWMAQLPGYTQTPVHNETNLLLNLGTSWEWGVFNPTWTMIYNPQGNTLLLFPNIALIPPWTNKYFIILRFIDILGSDRWSPGGGLFKGKGMAIAQFQYNFDVTDWIHDAANRL